MEQSLDWKPKFEKGDRINWLRYTNLEITNVNIKDKLYEFNGSEKLASLKQYGPLVDNGNEDRGIPPAEKVNTQNAGKQSRRKATRRKAIRSKATRRKATRRKANRRKANRHR